MLYIRDLTALSDVLGRIAEMHPEQQRRAAFSEVLQRELEFPKDMAELYAGTVLGQSGEGSADRVSLNASRIVGSWVRGSQEGNVGGWLSTMTETWQFDDELNYRHKSEGNESYISTGMYMQSSYSRPSVHETRGIWAPPDTLLDRIELFVMPEDGAAHSLAWEWVEVERYGYGACTIAGQRFGRQ